jgi:hypothetical protein
MNDPLFARAEQAIDRAYALREERQRLREAAEQLLDQQHKITQHIAAEVWIGIVHRRIPNE